MTNKTTKALKLAEQDKQEPVATMEVFSGWEDIADVEILYRAAKKLPDGEYKLYAAPVSAPKQEPVAWKEFNEWMHRELPSGTVIGDPGWWASKIYKHFIQNAAPVSAEASRAADSLEEAAKFLDKANALRRI